VSTDIVEGADLSVLAFDEDERVSRYVEGTVVSGGDEMRCMGCIKPGLLSATFLQRYWDLGEDCAAFEVEEGF